MYRPSHGSQTIAGQTFGRMLLISARPAAVHANADLEALARAMVSPPDPAKDGADDEENPYVPAGYTYLGQFIDHDLTFDTHSNFGDPLSFAAATDTRTPRLDLDNVYGRGPDDQPYLYADDGEGALLLGARLDNGVRDVLRNPDGRAIIGDPRNDENAIVAQIQSLFIRFHNALVARAHAGSPGHPPKAGGEAFEWARQQVLYHYHALILSDFLPRIVDVGSSTVAPIFAALAHRRRPHLRLYDLARGSYMPLEFAVAAYRFGHSMIRPGYRLNPSTLLAIFDGPAGGLRGFQALAEDRGIDWPLFFAPDLPAGHPMPNDAGSANNAKGLARTQLAYKIDTMVVSPIGDLPDKVAPPPHSLPERNLKRGLGFGLPSGQEAARAIGARVLSDDELSVRVDNDFTGRRTIKAVAPAFAGNAPLWFYVLAEAENAVVKALRKDPKADPLALGTRLGELGGAIVVETFVGLMLSDPTSLLNLRTGWTSINGRPTFTMAELIAEAATV